METRIRCGLCVVQTRIKKGFAEQLLGFGIESQPHRFGDHEYNQGVRDGIAEARRV